jgi:hypothetical protein
MWCKNCRQDTPGMRSADKPGMRCGRCGGAVGPDAAGEARAPQDAGHPAEIGLDLGGARAATTSFDDWQLDQNVRSLEARLGTYRHRDSGPHFTPPASREPIYRFDAAHSRVPEPMGYQRRMRLDRPARRSGLVAQIAIWLGLVTLATGGGLFGWSAITDEFAFARIGVLVAIGGAAIFLVGIVLLLERIWRNSRFAVQKLRQLDGQIRQLEQTTTMMGVAHGSPSQAFYSHLADGANPHLLLADLKGQIDMLAMNFARR